MTADGMITTEDSFYDEACYVLARGGASQNATVMRVALGIVDRGVACRVCGGNIVGSHPSSITSGHCDDCYEEAGETR